ncbi:hypothetical protein C1H46_001558 [Malus baccata]|uniref:Uncharacterized protein n=1 Tax=Malus baccata TaxID=106549 RepID=A0A540NPF7_MALBA|nr:hypothetical protein C1H46_001558 [Malus baccata]
MEQLRMILQDGAEVFSWSGPRVERRVEAVELAVARPGSSDNNQRPEELIGGPRLEAGLEEAKAVVMRSLRVEKTRQWSINNGWNLDFERGSES